MRSSAVMRPPVAPNFATRLRAMSDARAQRIRDLFDRVIELPAGQRGEYLRASCPDDPSITTEVLELIAAIEDKTTALDVDPAAWFRQTTARERGDAFKTGDDDDEAEADRSMLRGAVIGDFRIIRLLGRGGMSAVYEAEQISLGRRVALKVLQAWLDRRDARRRFIEEASTLARLKHPGIAQVIAAGSYEFARSAEWAEHPRSGLGDLRSLPWIAIELVEDARTIVQAGRGKLEQDVLALFALVADAVHYGHQQGFIHRDLKPANILVNSGGMPKVIDFSIARVIGPTSSPERTLAGELIGSPRYMSPEQIDPSLGQVDTRTDVYALGVVLYETLVGHLPQGTPDDPISALARAICEQPPRDPRLKRSDLSRDTAVVLLKALNRVAGDRYQSASEFAADLRRIIRREPIAARPPSVIYAAWMLMRRRPISAALAAAACVGIFIGLFGVALGLSREREARRETERTAWIANLNAADSSIRLGDGGSAIKRLRAIPQGRRGWEWNYLVAQADTSSELWPMSDAPAYVTCSRSGRWIAAVYETNGVSFFDAHTHELVGAWPDLRPSGTIEWSDDESLASIPTLRSTSIVKFASNALVAEFPNHPDGPPIAATLSRDGTLLAIASPLGGGLRVFDVASGRKLFTRPADGWVYRPDFTPDGRYVLWCAASTLYIVETSTWNQVGAVQVRRVSNVEPGGIVVAPDGATVAVICGTFVQLVDVATRTVRAELRGHAQRVHSVAFDTRSARMVTTSIDRTVRVWDAATGELTQTLLGHERPTIFATFVRDSTSDDDRVIATNDRGCVRTWDLRALGPVRQTAHPAAPDHVHEVLFDSNPARLLSSSRRSVSELNLEAPAEPAWQRTFEALDACIVPGRRQLARLVEPHTLVLEDLQTGDNVWTVAVAGGNSMVASPSGEFILVAEQPETIAILRSRDGSRVGTLPGDSLGNQIPKFSPDGSRVLITSTSGRVRLCSVADCTVIAELLPPGPHAHAGAFSADGSLLAYAHARDGITIADARTLASMYQINDIGGTVWSIAFSPDNTRIAVGGQDRITHIYDLPGGDEVLQLRDHTGSAMSIAWSRDGRYLATGGYDKKVYVYDGKASTKDGAATVDAMK